MSAPDYLGRWIDLAAHLLAQPLWHDPMLEICDELSAHFQSTATGTIDLCAQRVQVGVYRSNGIDAERYAPRIADHPLAQYYRASGDPRARSLADAGVFLTDPWGSAYVGRLRDEKLTDFVFVPLERRHGMQHRWLGLSSEGTFGTRVRDEVDRLGPLVRAVDAQASVLARSFGALPPPGADTAIDLSGRELAVLALVARGLTAVAIGGRLGISPRTVSKHQQNIYRKLDVADRLTAVMRAHALGILPLHRADAASRVTVVHSAVDRHLAPAPTR